MNVALANLCILSLESGVVYIKNVKPQEKMFCYVTEFSSTDNFFITMKKNLFIAKILSKKEKVNFLTVVEK